MKIKFQIWRYFSIFLLTIVLFSCQKEESVSQSPLQTQQLENFIDKAKATEIASEFVFDVKAKNSNETNFLKKEVSEVSAIDDEEQNTVFYIINYKDGGFLILAADNRSIPVLAYSDTETFDMSAEYYPSGLVQWLTDTKEDIKYLRENNIEQNVEAKISWTSINAFHQKVPPIEGEGCENEYEQVDRLLSTKWNQGLGYNTYMPLKNCSSLPNGRAWAGCVPVAIAQVMKYHQYPTSYNWYSMPLGPTGNTTIAALIKDIHDQINFPFPIVHYECDGQV